jgi:branched-chain amino acid transport system permease protein/neutral amino acid transport system permease protein
MSVLVASIGFGLISTSILAIAAVGFTLQFGVTNVFNLAYGSVMTGAAYAAYVANQFGVDIWVSMVLGGLFGAALSLLINRGLYTPFARHGLGLAGIIQVTLALGLILENGLQAIFGPSYHSYQMSQGPSFHFGSMVFTAVQVGIMGIALASMIGVHALLAHTKLGKAMRATAADAPLARSCGIRTEFVTDIAWLLSGLLCGIAGVILVMDLQSFTSTTGSNFLVPVLAAAVLGGIGQPYGAMLGALIIGMVSEVAAAVTLPQYKEVIAFVILLVVLLFRPRGILAEVASLKEVVA